MDTTNVLKQITRVAFGVLAVAIFANAVPYLIGLFPGQIVPFLHLKYRSPYCSPSQAAEGLRVEFNQHRMAERISRSSVVLRREGDLTLVRSTEGEFWIPASDEKVLPVLLAQSSRGIYWSDGWDVKSGDIVLDAGAYVGTYTKHALARGAKLVVAIEPSPASVECLRRNLSSEIAAGRVVVYPKGLWDGEQVLPLFVNPSNNAGNSFLPGGVRAGAIPVTTIQKLSDELHLPRIDFIKADVKGATERMLQGGHAIIARDRPRLALSTEEYNDDVHAIARLVKTIQPRYEMKTGPCLMDHWEVYTDVLFFR
jgi:FkbM family methyltransferase